MIRGARKNMIVVRTRDSRMFEEAYFVMRRDTAVSGTDSPELLPDMLWEANRILENATPHARRDGRDTPRNSRRLCWRDLLWFGIGVFSGGGVVGLCLLLF